MKELGTCPVCNGTGRMATPDNIRKYGELYGWYGYSQEDDSCTCTNCGGQTMYGKPTGQVRLRADGTPCRHEMIRRNVGRRRTEYTCNHCGFSH